MRVMLMGAVRGGRLSTAHMATSVSKALLGFHERLLLGHLMLQMVLVVGHLRLRVAVERAGRGLHRLGHGHRLRRLGLI